MTALKKVLFVLMMVLLLGSAFACDRDDGNTEESKTFVIEYTAGVTVDPSLSTIGENFADKLNNVDPELFEVKVASVVSGGTWTNGVGLNKNGSIRLYRSSDGNGSALTVTLKTGTIESIEVSFGSNNAGASCIAKVNEITRTIDNLHYARNSAQYPDNEKIETFAINSSSVTITNATSAENNQLHIWYIKVTYK